jgi:hypothetical protein
MNNTLKVPSKEWIKNDLDKFKAAVDNKVDYSVSFYFEYSKNGKASISQFNYAVATTDDKTEISLLERFLKTFEWDKVQTKDLQKFDILKKDKTSICFLPRNSLENTKILMDHLKEDPPQEDLSVLNKNKMDNVRGCIAEVRISDDPYYLFFKVDTFNPFKKGSLRNGFMATLNKDGIKRIDNENMLFGMKDKVAFYFHDGYFFIDPKGDSTFEKMFFLIEEYTKKAQSKVDTISNILNDVFPNISELSDNLKSAIVLSRMMARVQIDSIKNSFNKTNRKETFKRIKKIMKEPEFNGKLGKLSIDYQNLQIHYTEQGKFALAALLSDRPSETLLLGRKFLD